MKILIRDYLSSLKEREELDAVLPDLLSELGYTVYSRPRRGTAQRGVDIAAVGEDDDGERKVFLFSVKQGDLTRQDWDGTSQALRSSLNEIIDVYINNRIPARYRELKVVICLAFGGDVHEQVRESLTAYINAHSTEHISFDEWNGDKIANLIMKGILREEILPKSIRNSFQKAVAMVDEPDISYAHFRKMAQNLFAAGSKSIKARLRTARQLNICLWILYVWARDVGNLESPFRASEIAVLYVWELLRLTIGRKNKDAIALANGLRELISLHVNILSEFLEEKIFPYLRVQHGLSMSIGSNKPLDVNLALFDVLGRIGLAGLWLHWLGRYSRVDMQDLMHDSVEQCRRGGIDLIWNNPCLFLPITDRQCIDIALFLQLFLVSESDTKDISLWLREMAERLSFTIKTRGRYPAITEDYQELAEHPRDRSDDYFKETTAGSTVIPLIAAWLHALGETAAVDSLQSLVKEELNHCTLQMWMPDDLSEDSLYVGDANHGQSLCDLPLDNGGSQLLETIAEACRLDTGFRNLSAIKTGYWPIVLVACRHHHLPIPPGFWIDSLRPHPEATADSEKTEDR